MRGLSGEGGGVNERVGAERRGGVSGQIEWRRTGKGLTSIVETEGRVRVRSEWASPLGQNATGAADLYNLDRVFPTHGPRRRPASSETSGHPNSDQSASPRLYLCVNTRSLPIHEHAARALRWILHRQSHDDNDK